MNTACEEGQESAKDKLASIKEKYGREDGEFDLEDLDDDVLNDMGDSDDPEDDEE